MNILDFFSMTFEQKMFTVGLIAGLATFFYLFVEWMEQVQKDIKNWMRERKKMKPRIISMIICAMIITSGFTLILKNSVPVSAESVDGTQTVVSWNETFSDTDISDWGVWKAHPSVEVSVVNSELKLIPQGWAGYALQHNISIGKQDFTFSFNYRQLSTAGNLGNQILMMFTGMAWDSAGDTEQITGIYVRYVGDSSNILSISYDDGAGGVSSTNTAPLQVDLNYQFTFIFRGHNDSCSIRIYNKTGENYLHSATYMTWRTKITEVGSVAQIPNRIFIGDYGYFGNINVPCAYDNFTLTYETGYHTGSELNLQAVRNAINEYGSAILGIEYSAGKYRLGYDMTNILTFDSPPYYLEANNNISGRDDTVGEMITQLCNLYEYSGNIAYRNLAVTLWNVVLTHRQSDYGWTFGDETADYSDTNSKIIIGLVSLHEMTGSNYYLDMANLTATNLLKFQKSADGDVWGRIDRPSTYTIDDTLWFSTYFVLALFQLYDATENNTILAKANLTMDWIINETVPFTGKSTIGSGVNYEADFNDVSCSGLALRAYCQAYKSTGDSTYLAWSRLVKNYLVASEFVNNSKSFGLWAGVWKDRINQIDLIYNFNIVIGLEEYLSIESNQTVLDLVNSSLNMIALIQGNTSQAQSEPINETIASGVWGGAWNLNDTSFGKWTNGWWDETNQWGTWGCMVFYGWQGNLINALIWNSTVSPPYVNNYPIIFAGFMIFFIGIGIVIAIMYELGGKPDGDNWNIWK